MLTRNSRRAARTGRLGSARSAAIALVAILALLGAACTDSGDATDAGDTAGNETAVDESPTTTEDVEASEESAAPAAGKGAATVGPGRCKDTAGDVEPHAPGTAGGAEQFEGSPPPHTDLRSVTLSIEDDDLLLRYELGGAVPTDTDDPEDFAFGGVSFTAWVKGQQTYSLGASFDRLSVRGTQFTSPAGNAVAEDLDLSGAEVELEASRLSISVPLSALPRLEGKFRWSAATGARQNADSFEPGAQVADRCPNLDRVQQAQLHSTEAKVPRSVLRDLPSQP